MSTSNSPICPQCGAKLTKEEIQNAENNCSREKCRKASGHI